MRLSNNSFDFTISQGRLSTACLQVAPSGCSTKPSDCKLCASIHFVSLHSQYPKVRNKMLAFYQVLFLFQIFVCYLNWSRTAEEYILSKVLFSILDALAFYWLDMDHNFFQNWDCFCSNYTLLSYHMCFKMLTLLYLSKGSC